MPGTLSPDLLWSRSEWFTLNRPGAWLNDGWTVGAAPPSAVVALV